MGLRTELQTLLESVLGADSVYFQPPTGFKIIYPCIVYEIKDIDTKFANNNPYALEHIYTLTLMDRNPDSPTRLKIAKLPRCVFDRHFISDNLNHDVFTICF